MNLPQRLLLRAAKFAGVHPQDPALAAYFGWGMETEAGPAVTSDNALAVAAVYACVRCVAEGLSGLPLQVFRRRDDDGRDLARDHPLYAILHDRPNRWQTSFEWREMTTAHVLLRGNAYSEIVATGGAAVAELVPLHPDRVRPYWTADGKVAYRYSPARGGQRVILAGEMFHLRGLGLDDDMLCGLNPIQLHRETVGTSMAARTYAGRFLKNDGRPSMIITGVKVAENPEDKANQRKLWQEKLSGANRYGVLTLPTGMEAKAIGLSNVDAQFLETRQFEAVEIARMFRVPPHKIAILDRATFSNIEQQALEFVTDTLMPWAVRWEQAIGRDLFSDRDRETHFAAHNFDGLLRGDLDARSNAYLRGRMGGCSRSTTS